MKISEEREERGKESVILKNSMTYCSYDKFTSNKIKSINALEVERERRMSLTSIIFKKSGMYILIYILILDRVDVRAENITKDKEE